MARLSDAQISQLTERLSGEASPPPAKPPKNAGRLRRDLRELTARGDLGPVLARELAAYLHRPVRCTSGAAPDPPSDLARYASRGEDGLWIAMHALLASAMADAMIGGEGDATKLRAARKAILLAAPAAQRMIAAIADLLGLPAPPGVECVAESARLDAPLGGGSLAIGSRDYVWLVGENAGVTKTLPETLKGPGRVQPVSGEAPAAGKTRGSLETALAAARAACERLLRATVVFGAPRQERRAAPTVPEGFVRIGLPAPPGTVVLSIDAQTGCNLLRPLLKDGALLLDEPATLAQTGVETILTEVLHAFAGALEGADPEGRQALALTDDAILVAAPHDAIRHEIRVKDHGGRFDWLVPSALLRDPS